MPYEGFVTVRCVRCKKTRDIKPGEIEPDDVPFCDCGNVMVVHKATARYVRPKQGRAR